MKLPSREDKTKQTKTNEMRMCECKRITHHFNTFENDHTKTCHRFQFIDFTFVYIGLETKRHETNWIPRAFTIWISRANDCVQFPIQFYWISSIKNWKSNPAYGFNWFVSSFITLARTHAICFVFGWGSRIARDAKGICKNRIWWMLGRPDDGNFNKTAIKWRENDATNDDIKLNANPNVKVHAK